MGKNHMTNFRASTLALGMLLLCVFGSQASAQTTTPVGPSALSHTSRSVSSAPEQNYILGRDDVLQVDALGVSNFSTKTKIGADGTIQLPYLGSVTAANRSIPQLRSEIEDALRKGGYFSKPIVQVEVVSYASRYVTVLGEVTTPGLITVDRPYRVSEILARVGGIREDGADYIAIRSENGPVRNLVIKDLATGDDTADPYVQPGDKIFSPKAQIFYVKGQVKSPGSYALSPDMTLAMALAKGGGLTDSGSEGEITIVRKGAKISPKDLNVLIQPNDVIDAGEGLF